MMTWSAYDLMSCRLGTVSTQASILLAQNEKLQQREILWQQEKGALLAQNKNLQDFIYGRQEVQVEGMPRVHPTMLKLRRTWVALGLRVFSKKISKNMCVASLVKSLKGVGCNSCFSLRERV